MSSRVVYNRLLSDLPSLNQSAQLSSQLIRDVQSNQININHWKPDYEDIWRILHQNFTNPKAMNCFIFYDITDNKIRVRIAKYLMAKGAQRIQKSVYLANISKAIYREIFDTLVALEEVLQEYDSIFMVPIGEYHLAEMNMVGRNIDMSFSRSSEYVIFI